MRYVLLLPLWLVFNLLAYLIAPVLPLFAENRIGLCDNGNASRVEPRLPSWLGWFDTSDNSLYGDHGWRTKHCPDWNSYFGMVKWLWRNPAYGFECAVLSAKIGPDDVVAFSGDPWIEDQPNGKEGYCLVRIGDYWDFSYIKRISDNYCIKLHVGWKLKTYAEKPERVKTEPVAQYVFSPRIAKFSIG